MGVAHSQIDLAEAKNPKLSKVNKHEFKIKKKALRKHSEQQEIGQKCRHQRHATIKGSTWTNIHKKVEKTGHIKVGWIKGQR